LSPFLLATLRNPGEVEKDGNHLEQWGKNMEMQDEPRNCVLGAEYSEGRAVRWDSRGILEKSLELLCRNYNEHAKARVREQSYTLDGRLT
jgi:hypothetical protein